MSGPNSRPGPRPRPPQPAPMRVMAAAALAALLAACANPAPPPRATATLPATFSGQAASTSPVLAAQWWKTFGERALDDLVERALGNSLDLRQAAVRVDEAAVAVHLARAAQWPGLDLSAGITRSRASTLGAQPVGPGGAESSSHRVALSTSFEIDLWGRLTNATRAAQEQLLASEQARDTVRLALAGAVVQAWFALRSLDAQQAALDVQLKLRRDSLALVRRRVEGGVASGLEVAQAEGTLAALAGQQLELKRQRALLANQLGVLTAQPGLAVPVDARPLPAPAAVPPGLPSQLLQRRPDVQAAESLMRASFEQFDAVKKSAWPTLSLTGSFGAQSADLLDLLKSGARIWSVGPSLLWPMFDAGRAQARSAAARAQTEQATLAWQQAAQTAFRDVADALVQAEQFAAIGAELERQRRATADAARLSQRRYEAGYAGFIEVLDAQRGLQDAELAMLRNRQQQIDASVLLIKALGGGWAAGEAAR